MAEIQIEVDGSARSNPGPAGIGVRVLGPDGSVLKEISRSLGTRTNNQAEYEAMLCGLEEAGRYRESDVVVQTDSELVHRQLIGRYRVRDAKLQPLHARARSLLAGLPRVTLRHVTRDMNKAADRLAQSASAAEASRSDAP
jgi:ribonuclease HI